MSKNPQLKKMAADKFQYGFEMSTICRQLGEQQ
jgi:hypothetical protein